jgi:ABC-2 type transport system permease protein
VAAIRDADRHPRPHFVSFAQAVLFRGAHVSLVWRPLVAMLIIGSVCIFGARRSSRKQSCQSD